MKSSICRYSDHFTILSLRGLHCTQSKRWYQCVCLMSVCVCVSSPPAKEILAVKLSARCVCVCRGRGQAGSGWVDLTFIKSWTSNLIRTITNDQLALNVSRNPWTDSKCICVCVCRDEAHLNGFFNCQGILAFFSPGIQLDGEAKEFCGRHRGFGNKNAHHSWPSIKTNLNHHHNPPETFFEFFFFSLAYQFAQLHTELNMIWEQSVIKLILDKYPWVILGLWPKSRLHL